MSSKIHASRWRRSPSSSARIPLAWSKASRRSAASICWPRRCGRLNVRKVLLAMVNDVRVVLVKLGDRLHNMRTLGFLPSEKQERIARETLDIYAPIAHRLGMGLIRGELEDLAFSYLEPSSYLELQKKVTTPTK